MRGPSKITSDVCAKVSAKVSLKVMEELESRRLLSVSFAGGIVRVIGTAGMTRSRWTRMAAAGAWL